MFFLGNPFDPPRAGMMANMVLLSFMFVFPYNHFDRDLFGDPSSQFPPRLPELLGGPNIKPLLPYDKGSAVQILFEGFFE